MGYWQCVTGLALRAETACSGAVELLQKGQETHLHALCPQRRRSHPASIFRTTHLVLLRDLATGFTRASQGSLASGLGGKLGVTRRFCLTWRMGWQRLCAKGRCSSSMEGRWKQSPAAAKIQEQ